MEYEGDDHEFLFDDELEYIKDQLLKIKDAFSDDGHIGEDRIIAGVSFDYFDKEEQQWDEVCLQIIVESGYHEGAMIDINIDDIEELELTQTLKNKIASRINHIEKVLTKCTLPLIKTAQFSNGEAMYEKVSKRSLLKAVVRRTI